VGKKSVCEWNDPLLTRMVSYTEENRLSRNTTRKNLIIPIGNIKHNKLKELAKKMAYRQKRSICWYIRNCSIFVKTQKVQDVSRQIEKRLDRWAIG